MMLKKRNSDKRKGNRNLITGIIIVVVIIIGVIAAPNIFKQTTEKDNLQQQASSNIYEEVKSDNPIFSIANKCSWSETYIKCAGEVRDIETSQHSTSDIYIDLIAFDNDKECGYCNSRINLGEFSVGKIKKYSLICDIGKKVDILAKITVSARASQIFNGC